MVFAIISPEICVLASHRSIKNKRAPFLRSEAGEMTEPVHKAFSEGHSPSLSVAAGITSELLGVLLSLLFLFLKNLFQCLVVCFLLHFA